MEKSATEFLLAEFNSLQERAAQLEDIKSSRINFFLVIVAAVFAGVTSFIGTPTIPIANNSILIITSFILLLVGLTTLTQTVQYSIAIVTFYRKAGRIRRWFVDNNPEILNYVAFKPADDSPNIYVGASTFTFRGGDGIILLINSITVTVFVISLLSIQFPVPSNSATQNIIMLFAMGVTFFIGWAIQKRYIIQELKISDERLRDDIRYPFKDFPSENDSNVQAKSVAEDKIKNDQKNA